MTARIRVPASERFWPKVNKSGPVPAHAPQLGPCWLWTSALEGGGYPILWIGDGKSVRAHRFSYELHRGAVPSGLTLDHLCRVRHCVNPDHLDPCTSGENAARSPNAPYHVKARQSHCQRGHEFTPGNTATHNGRRECRACINQRARSYRKKPTPVEQASAKETKTP